MSFVICFVIAGLVTLFQNDLNQFYLFFFFTHLVLFGIQCCVEGYNWAYDRM